MTDHIKEIKRLENVIQSYSKDIRSKGAEIIAKSKRIQLLELEHINEDMLKIRQAALAIQRNDEYKQMSDEIKQSVMKIKVITNEYMSHGEGSIRTDVSHG